MQCLEFVWFGLKFVRHILNRDKQTHAHTCVPVDGGEGGFYFFFKQGNTFSNVCFLDGLFTDESLNVVLQGWGRN